MKKLKTLVPAHDAHSRLLTNILLKLLQPSLKLTNCTLL